MKTIFYEDLITESLTRLRQARQILLHELSDYPLPIAGCDVQYELLLKDRTRLAAAIKALESHVPVRTSTPSQACADSESW